MKQFFYSLFFLVSSTNALAHIERCNTDVIADEARMKGRNAWARKCGYVSRELENAANIASHYWSFASVQAPFNEAAPCHSGLATAGMCPKGCFTGSQKIKFNGLYIPIAEAISIAPTTYTSLAQGSLLEQEVNLTDFVLGDTKEQILVIATEKGRRIEVTAGHPMVLYDGELTPARSLAVGHSLLDEDLSEDKIKSIEPYSYEGKVYNIMSQSKIKEENLVISEGLITGSIRFQNEWADEQFRLLTRKTINIDQLN